MKGARRSRPVHFSLLMSDLPEPDDATFQLATGEELVLPGDLDEGAESGAPGGPQAPPALTPVGAR